MQTDRSRIIAYQRCPRERFLGYHIHDTGIQRKRKSLPLQFGSAFHEGVEKLLSFNFREVHVDGKALTNVDLAVVRAHAFLDEQFKNHFIGFDGETPDDVQAALEYGVEEQMALAEALLRAWWEFEGESFLEQYEVLEVEKEGRAILHADDHCEGGGEDYGSNDPSPLTLLFRPDALVRDRQSSDLYIVSWKTCATFGKRNVDQARTDMQSISEVWGVEATRTLPVDAPFKVEGVLYKFAVKGSRRKDNWDGLYKQSTHLIYGWRKMGTGGGDEAEWSWSYEWEKEDGTGSSRLGKGWKKVPIWREYPGGVKQWIDDLKAGEVFPRHIDPLLSVFPQALPVERSAAAVESWKRQVVTQEAKIEDSLIALSLGRDEFDLDYHFPQHTHSCHSYSGCSFIPICHEGVAPEPGDLYQIRQANHPEKEDGDE